MEWGYDSDMVDVSIFVRMVLTGEILSAAGVWSLGLFLLYIIVPTILRLAGFAILRGSSK